VDWIHLAQDRLFADSREHGIEPSDTEKDWGFP
jgi:hypothetical protein